MHASDWVPSRAGSAWKPGAAMIVNACPFVTPESEQQIPGEQAVPRQFSDDAHGQPEAGVGAARTILDEQVASAKVVRDVVLECRKVRLLERPDSPIPTTSARRSMVRGR